MKKYIILLLLIVFRAADVFAAMAVVDAALLSQFQADAKLSQVQRAKQLVESANHTMQLAKTVTSLEDQIKILELELKSLTENLQRANGFEVFTTMLAEELNSEKKGFVRLEDRQTGESLDPTKPSDLDKLITQTIPNYGTENKDNYAKVSAAYRQRGRKSALQSSEKYLYKAPKRLEQITDLVLQINESQSIKDSTDINNRLMAEILLEVVQLNIATSKLLKVQAAEGFDGEIMNAEVYSNDKTRIRKERFKPI
jgi:hypothetical protein